MITITKEEFNDILFDPNRRIDQITRNGRFVSTVTLMENDICVAKKIISSRGTQHIGPGCKPQQKINTDWDKGF